MRLLHQSAFGPETTARLRALSPEVEVIDGADLDGFDIDSPGDVAPEVLIWRRAPADLTRCPSLRWLQLRTHGVDHLAADPPWTKGITVTNARGVYSIPMAEYVTGMVLRIHQPTDWVTDQATRHWPADDVARRATVVRGRTAVIVGYGSIGREVGRQLAGLGMRILAVKAHPEVHPDPSFRVPGIGDGDGSLPERIAGPADLPAVVAEADVVIVIVPLTEATRGLVSAEVIAALRPGSWFINIARGGIVDEPALLDGLRAGRPFGAVLDVVATEPLPADSPLWSLPNVIITPHVSSQAMPAHYDDLVVENVRRYLGGEPLLNVVDPDLGY